MNEKKVAANFIEKNIEKVDIKLCIAVFIIMITLPILYISFFSFPSVDDYDYSMKTHSIIESGSVGAGSLITAASETVNHFYNNWQGHYIASFLMSFQPGVFGEQYYFLTTWLLIAITLATFLFAGHKLLRKLNVDTKLSLFLSILIWFFYIQTIPNINEGLFWFNGAFNYIPFLCLAIVLFSLLINQYNNGFSISTVVLCSVFGFVVSGGNAIPGFFNILIITLLLLYTLCFNKNKSNIKLIFFPLLASIIGFVIMLLAPGNAIRRQATEAMGAVYPNVLETIIVSAIAYFDFAINDWFGASQLLFFIFITPFAVNITKKLSGFKFSTFALLFLVQYAVVCGMLCTIYLGVGHFGAGRVTNVIYAVFLVSIIIVYGYLIGLLQEKEIIKVNFSVIPLFYKKLVSGVCSLVILIGIFLLGSNYYQYSTSGMALAEMRGNTHKIYQQQMEQRLELLNDDGIKEVVFEPHIKSFLFGEESLSENKGDWPNTSVADYYGKDSVSLKVVE